MYYYISTMDTPLIPGMDNNLVVAIFGIGTGLFIAAMGMFYKTLKRKRLSKKDAELV